jgi:hypothetical protein
MTPARPSSRAMILMEFTLAFLTFCLCLSVVVLVLARGLTMAQTSKAATRAGIEAQSIVESVKATDGSPQAVARYLGQLQDDGGYRIDYDGDWQRITDGEGSYWARVTLHRQGQLAILQVSLYSRAQPETVLFTLDAAQYFDASGEEQP